MLTHFQNFYTAGKRIKFARKLIQHYPPHLRHLTTLPWEIKNSNFLQILSRCGRKCKQIAFYPLSLCYSFTSFDIFGVQHSELFPILIANKNFSWHCSLLVYFYGQLVAPDICHSRRHCSVCERSTWYSVTRTRLWWKHTNRHSIQLHVVRN